MSAGSANGAGDVRVAVIGVGHLGRIHARLLGDVSGAKLAGVVDPLAGARDAVAAELGTTAFADHQPLLGHIDAAIVATPSRFHHAVACDLLRHGIHEREKIANSSGFCNCCPSCSGLCG